MHACTLLIASGLVLLKSGPCSTQSPPLSYHHISLLISFFFLLVKFVLFLYDGGTLNFSLFEKNSARFIFVWPLLKKKRYQWALFISIPLKKKETFCFYTPWWPFSHSRVCRNIIIFLLFKKDIIVVLFFTYKMHLFFIYLTEIFPPLFAMALLSLYRKFQSNKASLSLFSFITRTSCHIDPFYLYHTNLPESISLPLIPTHFLAFWTKPFMLETDAFLLTHSRSSLPLSSVKQNQVLARFRARISLL